MDLLDLVKVMLRRWYVTVPMVLVAAVGAILIGQQIRPEYKTSAAVVLVPPTVRPPTAGTSPRPGNPWLQVGEAEMAQAAQISVSSPKARATVLAAGGETGYEVEVVTRTSILTIDVTATSSTRALATVTAVTKLIEEEVAGRQREYRPRPGEQITTEVLDPGLDVVQSRSNVIRAQIVLVVLGLLLTAACAVVVDAITRRRAVPRAPRHSAEPDATIHAGQAVVHRPPVGALSSPPTTGPAAVASAPPAVPDNPVSPPAGTSPEPPPPVPTRADPPVPPTASPRVAPRPVRPAGSWDAAGGGRSEPDDTIVLIAVPRPDRNAR